MEAEGVEAELAEAAILREVGAEVVEILRQKQKQKQEQKQKQKQKQKTAQGQ